jgi:hypothetical protein
VEEPYVQHNVKENEREWVSSGTTVAAACCFASFLHLLSFFFIYSRTLMKQMLMTDAQGLNIPVCSSILDYTLFIQDLH